MARSTDQMILELIADNKSAVKGIQEVSKEQDKLEKNTHSIADTIKKNWLAITGAIAGALVVIKKAFDFGKEFAEYKQGMNALSRNTGQNADKIIEKLKEVSQGTISNKDLMLAANRAVALGVTESTETMGQLLEIARLKAQAMGITTTQAFNDIVTGIGRASPLILDNLGIMTKGWDAEAKAKGVSLDRQFILNKILQDGAVELQNAGNTGLTTAEKLQKLNVAFDNLKLKIGEIILPLIETFLAITDWIEKYIAHVNKASEETKKSKMTTVWTDVKTAVKDALEYLQTNWKKILNIILLEIEVFGLKAAKLWGSAVDPIIKAYEFVGRKIKLIDNDTHFSIKNNMDKLLVDKQKQLDALLGLEEKSAEMTLKQGTGSSGIFDIENKKKAELKKINDDYYQYIGDLQNQAIMKETADYETAVESLKIMLQNKVIAQEEYDLRLQELDALHKENLLIAEQENTNFRMQLQQNAFDFYGMKYEELTAKQRAEIIKMTQDQNKLWTDIKTEVKKGVETIASNYADGITKMIWTGEVWKKTFGQFIEEMIIEVGKLITKMLILQGIMAALNLFGGGIGTAIGKFLGLAEGTNSAPGGLAWVGERGKELMYVPRGAKIVPHHKLGFNVPKHYADGNVDNSIMNRNVVIENLNINTDNADDLISQLEQLSGNMNSRLFRR